MMGSIKVIAHKGSLRRVAVASEPLTSAKNKPKSDTDSMLCPPKNNSTDYRNSASKSVQFLYVVSIVVPLSISARNRHELRFNNNQYEFMSRLFLVLDSENQGSVDRNTVLNFVAIRFPVFRRRDEALFEMASSQTQEDVTLSRIELRSENNSTFDEIWRAVISCSESTSPDSSLLTTEIGIEGWLIFCRFISIAQNQEVRRRFSSRHLQQTMRHKKEGKGSEVVLVEVPPPDPPLPINVIDLLQYEETFDSEPKDLVSTDIDLNYTYVFEQEDVETSSKQLSLCGHVQVSEIGASLSQEHATNTSGLDNPHFAIKFSPYCMGTKSYGVPSTIKRSLHDLCWLHQSFLNHKQPGGVFYGRIIPPFPSTAPHAFLESRRQCDLMISTSRRSISSYTADAAVAMATAGANVMSSLANSAKTLIGDYVSISKKNCTHKTLSTYLGSPTTNRFVQPRNHTSICKRKQTFIDEVPSYKAVDFERYLNYVLECPALSSSFAVNAMLNASIAGLDAAKRLLDERDKLITKLTNEFNSWSTEPKHWKSLLSLSPLFATSSNTSSSKQRSNYSWVRTAAQIALAFHVHGVLESTGHAAASVKLQHASLPRMPIGGQRHYDDSDLDHSTSRPGFRVVNKSVGPEFENGVILVESELDSEWGDLDDVSGYDLLPAPMPPSERSVLCAGRIKQQTVASTVDKTTMGFFYGEYEDDYNRRGMLEDQAPTLGDISVEANIDKLNGILNSLSRDLERCLVSVVEINKYSQDIADLYLQILTFMDTWEGMPGQIITQKASLAGINALNESTEKSRRSAQKFIDGILWQILLASSALTAANEVRSIVHASKTASKAKKASDSAFQRARDIVESKKLISNDDTQSALDKLSIAQNHAIHSAIIEHEASTAKLRATTALAYDVKIWNVHRKREVFQACHEFVAAQSEISRNYVQSWEEVRDGFINAPLFSYLAPNKEIPVESTVTTLSCSAVTVDSKYHQRFPCVPFKAEELLDEGVYEPAIHVNSWDTEISQAPIESIPFVSSKCSREIDPCKIPLLTDSMPPQESQDISVDDSILISSSHMNFPSDNDLNVNDAISAFHNEISNQRSSITSRDDREDLARINSMQSLIDGLMSWGGNPEVQEDIPFMTEMDDTQLLHFF